MDHLMRPPLLGRLPSSVWTALCWCAAALFALMLFVTTTHPMAPLHAPTAPQPGILELGLSTGLDVVLAVALGLARRLPLAVFGTLLGESVMMQVLGHRTWPLFLAMDGLICYIAATRPRRVSLAAAVIELAAWPCEWMTVNRGQETFSDLLSTLLAVAASIIIPWTIGSSIRQQRLYSRAVRAQAVTAERLRIARELHDMVAHSIGVIAIQAGAASLVIDTQPAGARTALDAIEATSRETLAGLRRMLVSLRQTETEADQPTAVPAAGLEAVEGLAEAMDHGVHLEVAWKGQRRPLPPEIDLAAFRIIQESVTNTVRHSRASRCQVSVEYGDEELTIEIVDDGRGHSHDAATRGTGFGICGMRERVALLNGRFSAGPQPEGGFRVAARLPA